MSEAEGQQRKRSGLAAFVNRASQWTARAAGNPLGIGLTALMIICWAVSGQGSEAR